MKGQRKSQKTLRGLAALLGMIVLSMTVAAGCGNSNNNNGTPASSSSAAPESQPSSSAAAPAGTESAAAGLEPVELTYYYPGSVQNMADIEQVQNEMNKILKEKINATIKLNPIDWGSYEQKMNVMNGAGENYDLAFTAPWINNYFQNVSKGAYIELDALLDRYGPQLKASIPTPVWDAARVNGKIYGSINWQIVAMPYGVTVPKTLIEKYDIDLNAIAKYEDFEPYLAAWQEDYTPLSYAKGGADGFTNQPPYFGMDSIGGDDSVGWIRLDDPDLTVINQYETEEFKQFVNLARKWYQAGYVPKDAALRTASQNQADTKAGKLPLFAFGTPVKPGVEAETQASLGYDVVAKALSPAIITTNRAIATMTAISATSKNPERAMMFLELINTDKALYNLLCYGIENRHYKKVADNVIEPLPDSGYNPGADWAFGNQFNAYYTTPDAVGNWEATAKLNAEAQTSPLLGFSFDAEPIQSELAQTASILAEYKDSLTSGTADPGKLLPEMLNKLQQGGADKIIAEKQRQIDAWRSGR